MIKDPERLERAGLVEAFEAELAKMAGDLGVPDQASFREQVLAFDDIRDILGVWDEVQPEWRPLLVAELMGAARDVANSYKRECQRCGRCCRCQIYLEAADCERGSIRPEHVEVLVDGRFLGGEAVEDWAEVWESQTVVRMKHQESGSCIFHDDATHLCTIYEGRANHCRDFFCYDDLKRRQSFSFPDLVQHLGGQGYEPFAIIVVFINLRLWRKADELVRLDAARRREFGQVVGIGDEAALSQFLGPSFEERIRQAAAAPEGSAALKEYVARLEGGGLPRAGSAPMEG